MVIRALIFDVDGTLAETEEVHRLAFNRSFAEAELPWQWDVPLYTRLLKVTGGKERMIAFAAMHDPSRLDEIAARVGDLHRRKTALYTAMIAGGEVTLRPGIRDVIALAEARGLRLAIATTTSEVNVDALLSATLGADWRATFPVVAAGDAVAAKKPAPDAYRLALRELNLPASEAIAIEDSTNGVSAARAAGLAVVAYRSPYLAQDDLTGAACIATSGDALVAAVEALLAG